MRNLIRLPLLVIGFVCAIIVAAAWRTRVLLRAAVVTFLVAVGAVAAILFADSHAWTVVAAATVAACFAAVVLPPSVAPRR